MGTLGAGSFRVQRLNEKSKSFWEKGQKGTADGGEHPQGIWITEKQQIIRKVLKEKFKKQKRGTPWTFALNACSRWVLCMSNQLFAGMNTRICAKTSV